MHVSWEKFCNSLHHLEITLIYGVVWGKGAVFGQILYGWKTLRNILFEDQIIMNFKKLFLPYMQSPANDKIVLKF